MPEDPRLVGEVGRYMAVGGISTAVAFVLFNLGVHGFLGHGDVLHHYPIGAYVAANAVGMLLSYQLSLRWTFRHRPATSPAGGFTAYVAINVATMTIPVACLWFSRHVLDRSDPISDNLAANVIGILASQAVRFVLFKQFVFKHPSRFVTYESDSG